MEVNDISESKNQKKKKEKSVISEVFSDYCSSTSIHGIGYLGAEDKNIFEKVWWIIVFILSLTVCALLIRQTWIKWQESPVVLTFFTEQLSVWDVPFPAVTICPLNKVEHSKYNYTKYYIQHMYSTDKLKEEEFKKFEDISIICDLKILGMLGAHFYTDEDVFKNIKEVAPSLKNAIYELTFKSNYKSYIYFSPQITSEGLCYTFNALGNYDMYTDQVKSSFEIIGHNKSSTGWSIEDGYANDDENAYPERTADDGIGAGLNIIFYAKKSSKDYTCGEPVTGFKILIHNPAEAPKVSQQYILAPAGKQAIIAVNPKVITTSKGLANIPSNIRKCYFVNEKKLRFFKVYTQNNCKAECFANITKVMCECLPLYSPRDEDSKICGFSTKICRKNARRRILKYEILEKKGNVSDEVKKETSFQIFLKCNCLPSCASLNYEFKVSLANYDLYAQKRSRNFHRKGDNKSDYEATNLKIFFQDSHFMALHRSELYGQTEFLADIGGLLGLFMGFSVLSLLEIVYFLTVRLCCKLYSKRKLTYTIKN